LTGNRANVVAGGSTFAGGDRVVTMLGSRLVQTARSQNHDQSMWFYSNVIPDPALHLTVGGHLDDLRIFVNRTEFDPKLGLSWDILPNTTLRGAWLTTLRRPLIGDPSFRSGQTIEPTQVAGFDQFYDDFTGTRARRWGIGIDQKLSNALLAGDTLLIGGEWSQRQLNVPVNVLSTPGAPAELGWKERFGRAYLNWLPTYRLAFNLRLDWEDLHRTTFADAPDGFSEVRLLQIPVELRYFDPTGLFGLARTTLVREQGHFAILTGATSSGVTFGHDTFATVDVGIGWRFPGRPAIATLEFQNCLDSHFHYQDTDVINPRIFPRRTILGRVTCRL